MAKSTANSNNSSSANVNIEQARLTALTAVLKIQSQINDALSQNKTVEGAIWQDLNKKKKELKQIVDLIKEQNDEIKNQIANYRTAGDSIGSMSELQEHLKHTLTKAASAGVDFSKGIKSIPEKAKESKEFFKGAGENVASLLTLTSEVAQLNKEDIVALKEKSNEYESIMANLNGQITQLLTGVVNRTPEERKLLTTLLSQRKTLQESWTEANKFANMSKETKELYEELNEDLHKINKTFKKITTTAEVFFSSGRNAFGMMLIGAGMLAEKFHEIGREMGYSLTQATGFKSQMLIASILGEESAEAVKELGKELGDASHISNGMATDVALIAYNFKLSGEQAAFLSTAFGELQGKSWETGMNTLKYVEALSYANGIIPTEAMKDIAENSEFMAKFTKDGGKNIADAAIAAGKLGVGLKVAETMADHLLDYQTSVSDEMEASVLLGRDLNLGKARELMYNGKIDEGMQEALHAAGGIEKFNEMDYYQRQAVAKALGVQVSELQKMAAHEEALSGKRGVAAQQYEQISTLAHTIADSLAGKTLGAMGGLIISSGHLMHAFHLMGFNFSFIGNGIKYMVIKLGAALGIQRAMLANEKLLAAATAKKAAANALAPGATAIANNAAIAKQPKGARFANKNRARGLQPQPQPIAPTSPTSPAGAKQSMLSRFGSAGQIAALAVVLIAFAAAIFILSKAFENFDKLKNVGQTLGVFTAAIIGMGVSIGVLATILAPLQPIILPLVAAMLGFGAAIYLVGGGINLMGMGVQSMATGFSLIGETAAGLISQIPQLFTLAFAFNALAGSLLAIGLAGLIAGPMLKKINLNVTNNEGGGENAKTNSALLLEEIIGLRTDLNSGKVAVFIDGKKVSTNLAISERRNK